MEEAITHAKVLWWAGAEGGQCAQSIQHSRAIALRPQWTILLLWCIAAVVPDDTENGNKGLLWPLLHSGLWLLWPHCSSWWLPCQSCWEWTMEGKCGKGRTLRGCVTNSSIPQWLIAVPFTSWFWGWQGGLARTRQSCCSRLGSIVNLGSNNTSQVALLLERGWLLAGRPGWLISESLIAQQNSLGCCSKGGLGGPRAPRGWASRSSAFQISILAVGHSWDSVWESTSKACSCKGAWTHGAVAQSATERLLWHGGCAGVVRQGLSLEMVKSSWIMNVFWRCS